MALSHSARIGLWATSALMGGATYGLGWAQQDVSVPIWALLVLTFVPTSDLIAVVRSRLPDPDRSRGSNGSDGGDSK